MHSAQQVIKTFAIALAFVIVGAIVTAGYATLLVASDVVGLWQRDSEEASLESKYDYISGAITELHVDVKIAKLRIVRGEDFAIRSDSNYVSYSQRENRLSVVERDHNVFANSLDTEVVIYVPEAMKLDLLEVNNGAGNVEIDGIEAKRMEFDLGAGKAVLKNLVSQQDTVVSCGAGMTEITDSWLYGLDLDMGAGKVVLDGRLLGRAEISAGVGALELNLRGAVDDYYLSIEHGIGSVKVNGEKRSGETITYGSGPHQIYIDGGVGSIQVEMRGGSPLGG